MRCVKVSRYVHSEGLGPSAMLPVPAQSSSFSKGFLITTRELVLFLPPTLSFFSLHNNPRNLNRRDELLPPCNARVWLK